MTKTNNGRIIIQHTKKASIALELNGPIVWHRFMDQARFAYCRMNLLIMNVANYSTFLSEQRVPLPTH